MEFESLYAVICSFNYKIGNKSSEPILAWWHCQIAYRVFILSPEGWGNGLITFRAQTSNIQSYLESTKWIGTFGIRSIYLREWVNKLSRLKQVIFSHIWKVQNKLLQENLDGTFGMLGMLYIGYKVFILCPEGWGNGLISFPGSNE